MLLIECQETNEVKRLIESLPEDSYSTVRPKNIDASQIIQLFIDLSKVTIPAAIAAVSAYLVAKRTNPTFKIVIKPTANIEVEIQGRLNDKSLNDNQVYEQVVKLLTEKGTETSNEVNN